MKQKTCPCRRGAATMLDGKCILCGKKKPAYLPDDFE